jgi:diacylglycerol kinase (ATP)
LKKSNKISRKSFWQSVNAALEGIIHTVQGERNMRIHFVFAFLVLIGGIYFDLHYVEIMILLFAITFVLVAEMLNTAIEYLSDIVAHDEYDPTVKVIKDISAGAVFVAALNAGLTGYILIANRLRFRTGLLLSKIRRSPGHLTLIALILCVGIVLLIKYIRGEKNLLSGGMPSGHSALAFAAWMVVSLVTLNSLVSIMVFTLAVLVARSRMVAEIHTFWETVVGALIGALTTLFVFQILS